MQAPVSTADDAFCDGVLAQIAGDAAKAVLHYRTALASEPDHQGARLHLGVALIAQDQASEAVRHLTTITETEPANAEAHSHLATALLMLDQTMDAIRQSEAALVLKPDDAGAMRNMGIGFLTLNREAEALQWFQRAASAMPDNADILYCLGITLTRLGQLAEARQALDRAITLNPQDTRYYRARGWLGFEPAHLASLQQLAPGIASRPDPEQIEFHFAAGAAFEHSGDTASAMQHWIAGNALVRRGTPYDEAATLGLIERIKQQFTGDFLKRRAGLGHTAERPVFIVGMPRSGSTLIEQILASHKAVFGAGEIDLFDRVIAAIAGDQPAAFPECVATISSRQFWDLGALYDCSLPKEADHKPRVTDKMLANFRFVGLIHLILPNAKIIHARRDPLDTCLSCFANLFTGAQHFSYDLGELGRYYVAYQQLMDHWREVLPSGVMLDVDYETMIDDTEGQARRMLNFLGLEWDERCLAFDQTERAVRTASLGQVRQPIYRQSIGRAAHYTADLGTLKDGLAGR